MQQRPRVSFAPDTPPATAEHRPSSSHIDAPCRRPRRATSPTSSVTWSAFRPAAPSPDLPGTDRYAAADDLVRRYELLPTKRGEPCWIRRSRANAAGRERRQVHKLPVHTHAVVTDRDDRRIAERRAIRSPCRHHEPSPTSRHRLFPPSARPRAVPSRGHGSVRAAHAMRPGREVAAHDGDTPGASSRRGAQPLRDASTHSLVRIG